MLTQFTLTSVKASGDLGCVQSRAIGHLAGDLKKKKNSGADPSLQCVQFQHNEHLASFLLLSAALITQHNGDEICL